MILKIRSISLLCLACLTCGCFNLNRAMGTPEVVFNVPKEVEYKVDTKKITQEKGIISAGYNQASHQLTVGYGENIITKEEVIKSLEAYGFKYRGF